MAPFLEHGSGSSGSPDPYRRGNREIGYELALRPHFWEALASLVAYGVRSNGDVFSRLIVAYVFILIVAGVFRDL